MTRSKPQKPGYMYRLDEFDLDKVGDCWAAGRLKAGDLLLCVDTIDDNNYAYLLIQEKVTSTSTIAIVMVDQRLYGESLGTAEYALPDAAFNLLQWGSSIALLANYRVNPEQELKRR